jgi:hypothetical protein
MRETCGQVPRSVPYGQATHSETGENEGKQYGRRAILPLLPEYALQP